VPPKSSLLRKRDGPWDRPFMDRGDNLDSVVCPFLPVSRTAPTTSACVSPAAGPVAAVVAVFLGETRAFHEH
jgi:hypothetical protein